MEHWQECEIVKDALYIALERYASLAGHALGAMSVLLADPQLDYKEKLRQSIEITKPVSEAAHVLNNVRENLRQHELRFHRNSMEPAHLSRTAKNSPTLSPAFAISARNVARL